MNYCISTPTKITTPAPPQPKASNECLFCGSGTVIKGYCSSCNTQFPSARSVISLSALHKAGKTKKYRPAILPDYRPHTDGLLSDDELSADEPDELDQYSRELAELGLDSEDADITDDNYGLLPDQAELESLPWL